MPGQRENQELQVDIWAQMWTSRISKARQRGQAANNRSFFTSRELQELASNKLLECFEINVYVFFFVKDCGFRCDWKKSLQDHTY